METRTKELFDVQAELCKVEQQNQVLQSENNLLKAENRLLKKENVTFRSTAQSLDKFKNIANRFADHYGKQRLVMRNMKSPPASPKLAAKADISPMTIVVSPISRKKKIRKIQQIDLEKFKDRLKTV